MTVRVLSTLAFTGLFAALRPGLGPLDLQLAPTGVLLERIAGGALAEIAILTAEATAALAAAGTLDGTSCIDLARSHVGLAVRRGAPRPDISTPAAVRAALLAARSVALSRTGASGLFMAGLLDRLGIAAEVHARATIVHAGYTGERVVSGEADLAVQQVSELMIVPGLDILGPLPPGIAGITTFTGGLFPSAPSAARTLLHTLQHSRDALRATGLEPC